MTTIAIIGAGPGLGAAVAERFGREGFAVALISRSREKLAGLAEGMVARGITARAYPADVHDRDGLTHALATAADELGAIEVLQYSPVPRREFLRPVLETSAEDLCSAAEFSILGPVAAVGQVLPGMSELGRGTILLVNGSSAATPYFTASGENRIERYELTGEPGTLALGPAETILDGLPSASYHNGGRIAFGPDGMLYATVGDAGDRGSARRTSTRRQGRSSA